MFNFLNNFIRKNTGLLIRLDDISANMSWKYMDKCELLFDKFNIKPLLGIIPENKDPELLNYPKNSNFWERVESWKKKGWEIAMHGYEHLYDKKCKKTDYLGHGGYTEFVGDPYELQYQKIKSGLNILKKQDLNTKIFFAPNHTFDENTITNFLDSKKIKYEKLSRQPLLEKTAKKISDGNIVGWYQGKMEWGPRALGNRSILADPRNSTMKDILNEKIKHRESFRPFAPSVLEEFSSDYFEIDIPSPYMLMVANVKQPKKIPAVTHVDGTARLQTVSKESNPLYYDLINEFYKITKIPIIINTSMNVMGEPIVNTPSDAYNMILKTDMDCLVLGNNLISR